MAIRKPIELGWKGKDYKLLITMEVIDRIEDEVNLTQIANQANSGDIRFSKVAKLFAVLLDLAGASVTQEEVYQSMFSDAPTTKQVVGILNPVMMAIFPDVSEKKPSEPQGKKRSTATRGKKSTK